ncbi:TonB-dependent receptor [Erythrobacter sp. 3-20A1M]|uniref:TonB-dependent receptor n=1 Tax=Erythrobacter sp. 3-20A1M TaxID=2653850 RepID=UPI001BFCAAAF|nr:TonB-dependent receptor [Erythrobacter sp. 3-20A1M]QWC57516.1 TonB-dependent receptor [Erythrobacter sp. 3-20A1M]
MRGFNLSAGSFGTGSRSARRLAAALALGVAGSAIAVATAVPAHAQESSASLRGNVQGASEITAVEVNTGFRRTVPVSADGTYNFAQLRPGTYRLEITTPNGVRQTDEFTLLIAQDAVLDFDDIALAATTPAPGDTTSPSETTGAEIIVTAGRIKTNEGGEVGANITQREISTLPQNNRNFLAFADLAPGVQFVNPDGQSRIQGGAQDSRTVNVFIDGVGQKDYVLKNGITGQDSSQGNPFPQLAVGEYRVISSNYKAEFDQVSSVAITAGTKSGTNEFHGEAFIDYTDQSLRQMTPLEKFSIPRREKVETRDMQFGGALGGPIIPDVMHFFVTYEGKRIERPIQITPGFGLPVTFFPEEYQDVFGSTNSTFNEDLYFGKISVLPASGHLIEVSGKYRDESGDFLGSGSNSRSTLSFQNVKEFRGLLRYEYSADNFINEFKATYEDVKWAPTPAEFGNSLQFNYAAPSATDPTVSSGASNILRVGGGSNYQDKGQKGIGLQDDFTWIGFENHTIKAGIKAKWVDLNSTQLNNFNPRYEFNAVYNPATGTYITDGSFFNDQIPYRVQFGFQNGPGSSVVESSNFQLGLYIQDDWDVTDRLTLNLGIRWDYEETPAYLDYVTPADARAAVSPANYPNLINADYDINDFITDGTQRKPFKGAFQPRVGFSYALDADRTYVVFGGYGRSYDRNQFDFLQQEISVGAFTTRTFNFITGDRFNTCSPGATCVPFDPIYFTPEGRAQLVQQAGFGGGRELRFITNDLKVPYSDQFSLGLRSQLASMFEAEVGYTHIESKDGFAYLLGNRRADGSFFAPAPAVPSSPFGFAPPGFGSIIIGTNGLETRSDSGYLKLVKRYTQFSPWNLTATYTYTDASENRGFNETFALDFPSTEDYPFVTSRGVRKHRLVIAGAVDLPIAVTLSGKFQIASPPYIQSFVSTGGANPTRDVISNEAASNGDRWGFRQLDLAITKYIPLGFLTDRTRIKLRADIINALNDRNYSNYVTNPTATNYLSRTGLGTDGPPRTLKVSAGFEF